VPLPELKYAPPLEPVETSGFQNCEEFCTQENVHILQQSEELPSFVKLPGRNV
jgi:hypothetical protein